MFGGKSMGGGNMLRSVGRAVTRTNVTGGGVLQEPLSSSATANASSAPTSTQTHKSTSSNNLTLSSSSASHNTPNPKSPTSCKSIRPYWSNPDDFDWVSVDGSDDERSFGPVPSLGEVQSAVSALQQFNAAYPQFVRDKYVSELDKADAELISSPNGLMHRVSSVGSESDWIEPSVHLCNSRSIGIDTVYDAFHMLQNDQAIKRMVVSLSSDKSVWDAVLNNEAVKEIRESYLAAENSIPQGQDDAPKVPDEAKNFVQWIFDNTKDKVMDVIGKITKLVNEIFHRPEEETASTEGTDPFTNKLRTSFMLSVMVLLIVAVSRAH